MGDSAAYHDSTVTCYHFRIPSGQPLPMGGGGGGGVLARGHCTYVFMCGGCLLFMRPDENLQGRNVGNSLI